MYFEIDLPGYAEYPEKVDPPPAELELDVISVINYLRQQIEIVDIKRLVIE